MSCKACRGEARFTCPIGDLYCSAACCEKVTNRTVRISTERRSSFLDVHQDDPVIGLFRSEPSLLKAHELSSLEEVRSGPSHYKLHRALVGVARAVQRIGPLKGGEGEEPAASSSKRSREEQEPTSRKEAAPMPRPLEEISVEMLEEIIKQLEITEWEPLFKLNKLFRETMYDEIGYLLKLKGFDDYETPLAIVVREAVNNQDKWPEFTINAILKVWLRERRSTVRSELLINYNHSDLLNELAMAKDWVNFEFILRLPLSDKPVYFDITEKVYVGYLVYSDDPANVLPILFWLEENRKPPEGGTREMIMNDWFIPALIRSFMTYVPSTESILFQMERMRLWLQWKGPSGKFLDVGAYFKYKMPHIIETLRTIEEFEFYGNWRGPNGEYIDFTDESILKWIIFLSKNTVPRVFVRDWKSPSGQTIDPKTIGEIYLKLADPNFLKEV